MGDSLRWMALRYQSIREFFAGFVHADPAVWYRPIAQCTVQSLLYPLVGFHPLTYRVVAFALFFSCTVAVFHLVERITQSRNAAWLSTIYFASHITHAFTTYDVAFTPELVFTLFYIGSASVYVSFLRNPTRRGQILSAALFVCSLLSKETAVGLPFVLLAIWILLPKERRVGVSSLVPHFVILAAYLLFAVGYIHIRGIDFQSVWRRPTEVVSPGSGYELVLGKNILDSVRLAFAWAFNISRGINGQWPPSIALMASALRIFRVLICAGALVTLFTPRRKFLLIGIAWFLIAAAPALPLLDHFLPYYLFAPIVGFSLAVGTVLDELVERFSRVSPKFAWAVCVVLLAIPVIVNADTAGKLEETHFLLGGSARSARDGMNDVRALYPKIPAGTTLVFFNEERGSLSWDMSYGMFLQMVYNDLSLKSEYSVDAISATAEDFRRGKALAFKLTNGHLVDFTPYVKQLPALLLAHPPDTQYRLELSSDEVRVTDKEYGVRIPQLKDVTLNALVAYNGILKEPFRLELNSHGEGKVAINGETPPGLYTFVAMQPVGEPNWVTVGGSIRVTP